MVGYQKDRGQIWLCYFLAAAALVLKHSTGGVVEKQAKTLRSRLT